VHAAGATLPAGKSQGNTPITCFNGRGMRLMCCTLITPLTLHPTGSWPMRFGQGI
jgi:hypothetical protein